MRKITIQREVEFFEEKCPKCKKSIKGTSESQTRYNFKLHKSSCKGKEK